MRDFYGTTQVVAETEEMVRAFKAVTRESTISVEGAVRERASKNPKLPTGDIEIVPEKLEVLGRCRYNELPFQINRSREADEAARLRYRYLDLRNPEVKANIILRSKVISALRRAMEAQGFMEITTPILTVSSPEARATTSSRRATIRASSTPCPRLRSSSSSCSWPRASTATSR